jgi:hypothetical protein
MALIDKKLTELTEILSVPDNAFIHVVDPNDVSQSPQGSSYKAKKSTIGGAVKAQVTVSGTVKTNVNNADPIVYLKGSVDALLAEKQDTLVNGLNIASINSQNLLNGGNIEIANTIPTLQEVLDNNHDLIDARNFQGNEAGLGNTGKDVNALGGSSAFNNSGSSVNALGNSSAQNNTASDVNAIGNASAFNNSGTNVNALGNASAQNNTFSNVNLFGNNTQADEDGQTVFAKTFEIFARLSTLLLTATRKYILPNQSGTIALESYVDAIPNPTLNVLPKKGASGFVDSAISEDATNVLSAKVLRLAAGLTAVNEQDLTTLGQVNTALNLKNPLISNLEFNDTDLTVWNNGKGNISSNTSFGDGALRSNTTGNSNSFYGLNSGLSNTTGSFNSFYGLNSGLNNISGVNNSFYGVNSGLNNTTGTSNSFYGANSGRNNTTGRDNSFYGVNSGLSNTTGVNNNFYGLNSGRFISDASTPNTNSINSLFLGNDTKPLADNQTNQIVIGNGAIGSGSNSVTLGDTNITKTVLRGNVETNGLIKIGQFTTATEPAYLKGASFFNTTLNKMRIGGATAYETVISS